jgi:hypothetical protein
MLSSFHQFQAKRLHTVRHPSFYRIYNAMTPLLVVITHPNHHIASVLVVITRPNYHIANMLILST